MPSPARSLHVVPIINELHARQETCGQAPPAPLSALREAVEYALIVTLAWTFATSPSLAAEVKGGNTALVILNRSVTQEQGEWIVNYRVRYTGKTGVIVTPDEIVVKAEGWVSNSRVPSHALPRWSSLVLCCGQDLSTVSDVVAATEEAQRCRERLVVSFWTEDQKPPSTRSGNTNKVGKQICDAAVVGLADSTAIFPLSLSPEAILRVRLRFEHQHILYGEYDPLLVMCSGNVHFRSCVRK